MLIQAVGRVDRLGQTRPVHIHRYIMSGTIEVCRLTIAIYLCPVAPSSGECSHLTPLLYLSYRLVHVSF